ncbi:MAG: hypothetical protein JW958_03855 [Candidatus Eisenbacteria bacterium]|nr:hypothetical protein [Candidatus Eisenbacteria bacterium]
MPLRSKIPLFLTPAVVFLSLALVNWLQIREARTKDFHWTPGANPLTIEEAAGDVEVFAAGARVETLLDRREMAVRRDGEWIPLARGDISLRINNLHRVNGPRLFALGIFLALGAVHLLLFFLPVRIGRGGV